MDLVRLATLLLGDQASAEDVVQDVFTRMYAQADRLAGNGVASATASARARWVVFSSASRTSACRWAARARFSASRVARTKAKMNTRPMSWVTSPVTLPSATSR
jgi:hypothetical protein